MIVDTTCTVTHTTVADASAWYSVPFQYETVLNVPQISVTLGDEDLVYATDYTVGVSGLQLTAEPIAGRTLVITRSTPFVQDVDFQTGLIDPDEIEHSFDLAAMRDQEIKQKLDEIANIPDDYGTRITAIEEKIPDEATVANKLADKNYVGTQIAAHADRTDNPHSVTAAQVGLGNCNNTSDLNKPVSTATQNALDLKANSADLATVATSGSYSDLSNTPTLGTMAAEAASDYTPTASLAAVALSGNYSDLSGLPTLGTAAAAATTDFATATQGTKADTAVQPGDLATVATSGSYNDLSNVPFIPTTLDDISDVTVSSVQDGEFLRYNGLTSKWENASSTASVGFDGITGDPYDNTNLATALNSKAAAGVVDTLLAALYPVGSIYIGTQGTCPLATLMPGTTWAQIQGRYLLASGTLNGTSESYSATNTVAAGLPDITAGITARRGTSTATSGAMIWEGQAAHKAGDSGGNVSWSDNLYFNAAWSNSIFNQSATVRPTAYVVNVWRRTA